ncbi:MAG: 50S ribosomal protein L11 methyltransferase [Chlorobi bacterium]|nr:50S ribosomal protein L11 methyltransferase [Chlorobiota bacterium]
MNYIELSFIITPFSSNTNEILTARLSILDYNSFKDTSTGFMAYTTVEKFNESEIKGLIEQLNFIDKKITYSFKEIQQQNWNQEWERNFEQIVIADKCVVYAPFHTNVPKLDYNILIEPKMAFGTGHHATTAMMIEHLLALDIAGKKVLDMGSGTGVLSILASLKNAELVFAVDNDKWAYNNCVENIERNNCDNIIAIEGDVNSISNDMFDVILSNINRNTLINDIDFYANVLNSHGLLIMSGFYVDDIPAVEQKANAQDLFLKKYLEKENWASVLFAEK